MQLETVSTCQICHENFFSQTKMLFHIIKKHHIKTKDYYHQFYKKENEEFCANCKKIKKFICFKNGYNKYCSTKCSNAHIETKNKKQQTSFQNNSFAKRKEKMQQTNLKKYGCINPFQNEKIKAKIKETILKKYNCINPSQSNFIKIKKKLTTLKHYNVENPSQSWQIQNKKLHSKILYILPSGKKIFKQGYEPKFLDYLFSKNILNENDIIYFPKGIKYFGIDKKEHIYFPDFYIPKWNLIIEIKSTWSLNQDKNVFLKEQETINQGYKYIRILDNQFFNFEQFIKIL